MFTWILAGLAALVVVVVVVHEIRSWRKPGRRIGQNAPMNDGQVNDARFTSGGANSHDPNTFGGPGGL